MTLEQEVNLLAGASYAELGTARSLTWDQVALPCLAFEAVDVLDRNDLCVAELNQTERDDGGELYTGQSCV